MNMKYKFVFTLLLLSTLLLSLVAENPGESQLLDDQTPLCDPELPYLSVGDYNLTEDNFTKVIMSSGPTLVIITGKGCVDCCQYEKLYQEIRDEVLTNKTLLHDKDVKIARVKFEDVPFLQDRVKKLPEFFFYYKEMGYSFEHDYNSTSIGLTISKVLKPIRLIKEYSEFKEFLEEEISFDHNGQKVTAIKTLAIFSKKDELQYETKEFKKTASHFSVYHDLQFALITKESIIDQIHQERGPWFPAYMRSTIILINRKGEERKIDPTIKNTEELQDQILLKGKAIVEPLSIETQQLYRKYQWPLLVSFVDLEDTKTLQPHLDVLTEIILMNSKVGKKFEGHLAVAYLNHSMHENKRDSVGIFHKKTPALAIVPSDDRRAYPFPENHPITTENLVKFIRSFFEGKLTPFKLPELEEIPEEKQYQNIDL